VTIKYLSVASLTLIAGLAVSCSTSNVPDANTAQKQMPANHGMSNMPHTDGVNQRGDEVMGFDHMKTTHHFRLLPDGGAIEVGVNDASDSASRDQIRQHLSHIAGMFADGNFNAPMLIHGREPDGVSTMQRLKADIKYEYEQTAEGGRVRISTGNPEALKAVHDFLRFQISDHQTGDPTEVQGK
jgi:hypothetical protein